MWAKDRQGITNFILNLKKLQIYQKENKKITKKGKK